MQVSFRPRWSERLAQAGWLLASVAVSERRCTAGVVACSRRAFSVSTWVTWGDLRTARLARMYFISNDTTLPYSVATDSCVLTAVTGNVRTRYLQTHILPFETRHADKARHHYTVWNREARIREEGN